MRFLIYSLVVFLTTPVFLFAQEDSTSVPPPIIYDTVIVKKAPFVVKKTVYIKGERTPIKADPFLLLNTEYAFFNQKLEENEEGISFTTKNSYQPGIYFGLNSKIRLKLGASFYQLNKNYTIHNTSYSSHTINITVKDTLDIWYIIKRRADSVTMDTITRYTIEERKEKKEVYTRIDSFHSASQKQLLISIPIEAGIPIKLRKFIVTPSIGIAAHIPLTNDIKGEQLARLSNYLSLNNSFISSYLSVDLSVPVWRTVYLNTGFKYQTLLRKRELYSTPFSKCSSVSVGVIKFFKKD